MYELSFFTIEDWKTNSTLWTMEHQFENSVKGALDYLRSHMYVIHDMKPLRYNGTQIKRKSQMLWQHRNRIVHISPSELRMLSKFSTGLQAEAKRT